MKKQTYTVYDFMWVDAESADEAASIYQEKTGATQRPRVREGQEDVMCMRNNLLAYYQELAAEDLTEAIKEYIEDNPDESPETIRNEMHDRIMEIADSCTPIYNYDIKELMFFGGDEVLKAWENAGIGELPNERYPFNFMGPICIAIEQHLYRSIDDIIEELLEENK